MKEYIYLDMGLINSYLAQLDEGILMKMVTGQETNNSQQEDGGNEEAVEIGGNAGIGSFINGSTKYTSTEIDKFSTVYSQNNTELIETALDDYSLDVLLKKLKDDNKLKKTDDVLVDGDIFFVKDKFNIFNFSQLQTSVEKENMRNVLQPSIEIDEAQSELDKIKKTPALRTKHAPRIKQLETFLAQNDPYINFGHTLRFANYTSALFPDTTLFKVGKYLSICNSEAFRVNTPVLSFISQTKREVSLLGIIMYKRNKKLAPEEGVELESKEIIATAPAIFSDIMLESFGLVEIGDYFVRPIAIYFDSE